MAASMDGGAASPLLLQTLSNAVRVVAYRADLLAPDAASPALGSVLGGTPLTVSLSAQAALATGVSREVCAEYFSGLDYRLSYPHLAGLTEFFRRLVLAGRVPDGTLAFLPAA